MDKMTEEEAALALKLAKKIGAILKGRDGPVQGAAIGQSFAGWLMAHPPAARQGLANGFVKYVQHVCDLIAQMDDEQRKH